MKSDMGGAAAALAAMRAIAILKPRINVIAAIPSSENLPGGGALRPGDVITHHGGKTSEVLNTDAEGRLVLADALAFLAEQKPPLILDAATLTGACMVALGEDLWGIMGNDRRLIREVLDAGDQVGEPGWELPLWRQYKRHIDSPIADVKNIGLRYGGAIHAALFLVEFVDDIPWAHLDVAGTAFQQKEGDYWGRGATGNPARTFIRFMENRAARGKGRKKTAARRWPRSVLADGGGDQDVDRVAELLREALGGRRRRDVLAGSAPTGLAEQSVACTARCGSRCGSPGTPRASS